MKPLHRRPLKAPPRHPYLRPPRILAATPLSREHPSATLRLCCNFCCCFAIFARISIGFPLTTSFIVTQAVRSISHTKTPHRVLENLEFIVTNLACTSNCGDGFIKCVQIEFLSANGWRKFEVRSKTTLIGYLESSCRGENLPNRLSLWTV